MLKKHCDGCDAVIYEEEGSYVVSVIRRIQEGTTKPVSKNDIIETSEKRRELCNRCMAKVRPGLDAVDGKTD